MSTVNLLEFVPGLIVGDDVCIYGLVSFAPEGQVVLEQWARRIDWCITAIKWDNLRPDNCEIQVMKTQQEITHEQG